MVAVHTSMVSGGGGLQKNSGLMKKVVSGEAKPLFKANPTYSLVWENIRHFGINWEILDQRYFLY